MGCLTGCLTVYEKFEVGFSILIYVGSTHSMETISIWLELCDSEDTEFELRFSLPPLNHLLCSPWLPLFLQLSLSGRLLPALSASYPHLGSNDSSTVTGLKYASF